jgi:hypothetical protein
MKAPEGVEMLDFTYGVECAPRINNQTMYK